MPLQGLPLQGLPRHRRRLPLTRNLGASPIYSVKVDTMKLKKTTT
jgi:hypothetical protein